MKVLGNGKEPYSASRASTKELTDLVSVQLSKFHDTFSWRYPEFPAGTFLPQQNLDPLMQGSQYQTCLHASACFIQLTPRPPQHASPSTNPTN